MDISQIDVEITVKMKEAYKSILKRPDVSILFELPNPSEGLVESTIVSRQNHNFALFKHEYIDEVLIINKRYTKYISETSKIILKTLSTEEKTLYLRKNYWYLWLLTPIRGKKIYDINTNKFIKHTMNYNGVTIELTRMEYERLVYYAKYIYKLHQIYRLNAELNIIQEFNVIFDDDAEATDMYNDMYTQLKGIIAPMNKPKPSKEEDEEDN